MTELATLLNAPLWSQGERALICTERHDETQDGDTVTATTFFFQTAPQPSRFDYLPGQFLLLTVTIAGRQLSRAYSLSSAPTRPHALAITVKRVAGGEVSNYLIDTLQPGMMVSAQPPQGQFHLPQTLPAQLLLLCAGSGITPMLSMTRTLRDLGLKNPIHFVYSARHENDVIFRDELLARAKDDPDFHLTLLLETPSASLSCHPGRLDADLLAEISSGLNDYQIFLCGPSGYMDAVNGLLDTPRYVGVPRHEERFSPSANPSPSGNPSPSANPSTAATSSLSETQSSHFALSVPAFGTQTSISAEETLLDALEREGLPIIGACRAGVCGSCKCKVESGEVQSSSAMALTPEQVAEGYVLACSSQARSDLQLTIG